MVFTSRTTRALDSDVRTLSQMLARMGGLAESQVAHAIEALATADRTIASQVVAEDDAIDSIQKAIDETVIETIARRHPVADDLREILGILRIANEFARIGDLTKSIGRRILVMTDGDAAPSPEHGLRRMALAVFRQLRSVLDSLVRRDAKTAVDVWARDQYVDRLCAGLSRRLVAQMAQDPNSIALGIHLLFCAKNLERMGDHATNIAEAVYYMVEGQRLMGERPKADVTGAVTT
ncbi:MAG TPA: phosphate signaling complex protein PhoU [Xanthobacteraceae bacterium]|nr:phosphate signaling complex protein PhoU [Xanthobacteraceae bacterium]